MNRKLVLSVVSALLAIFIVPALGMAACTNVTSLPRTISTSGCYQLTGNLTTTMASGNAITVSASDVVLDLGGYTLSNSNTSNAAIGINIYNGQTNVTVKNGSLKGFAGPISEDYTSAPSGNVIDNVSVTFSSGYSCGIIINGNGTIIRNSRIQSSSGASGSNCICAEGANERVINNDVLECETAIESGGSGMAPIFDNNRISSTNGGITAITVTDYAIVTRNFIRNYVYGITTGLCRDNVVMQSTYPYSCTDAGNNSY